MTKLNIAIIGAGVSGLCAAKYAKTAGHSVIVYEQTENIGGTWVYTDAVGKDEYSLDIHTSMYNGLRTNLPKEIMGFDDFPIPSSIQRSYIRSEDMLAYLGSYANHFNILELIKFRHYVIRVRPIQDTKWEIIVNDLINDRVTTHIHDAIFVCNGHNSTPSWPSPKYPGADKFAGKQWHSHDYRRAEAFQGRDILIIGGGPSGIDLTNSLAKTANRIFFSHYRHNSNHKYPLNVTLMGAVREFKENCVIFVDGTEQPITDIIYCTGYKYTFPFLSVDCGISVDNNYIKSLYKHSINIKYPTMALIGLPFTAVITQMIDIQVRFCLRFFSGEKMLPTTNDMERDTEINMEKRWLAGLPKKKAHTIGGEFQRDYYNQLATVADINNIREIYLKIYEDSYQRRMGCPSEYRYDFYRIIDNDNFERTILTS